MSAMSAMSAMDGVGRVMDEPSVRRGGVGVWWERGGEGRGRSSSSEIWRLTLR
jgi:hypothetical protein